MKSVDTKSHEHVLKAGTTKNPASNFPTDKTRENAHCSKSIQIFIPHDLPTSHLPSVVIGIIKHILFQRDQMLMPFDVLDCHAKSRRRWNLGEEARVLHTKLTALFTSIKTVLRDDVGVKEIVIVFGTSRFNIKEMHSMTLPCTSPSTSHQPLNVVNHIENVNAVLRKLIEEDDLLDLPPAAHSSIQIFLKTTPNLGAYPGWEPLLKFLPIVAKNGPDVRFNLVHDRAGVAKSDSRRRRWSTGKTPKSAMFDKELVARRVVSTHQDVKIDGEQIVPLDLEVESDEQGAIENQELIWYKSVIKIDPWLARPSQ